MSWIKKFLRIFNNHEIKDDENVQENTNLEVSPNKQINHVKELEAKIAYHYPKGKFRFPLIPDEKFVEEKQNYSTNDKRDRNEKKEVKEMPVSKPAYLVTEDPIFQQKKVEKIVRRNNRPFQPTVVPSPVYGFKRPEPIVEPKTVEFELSSFEQGKEILKSQDEKIKEKQLITENDIMTSEIQYINEPEPVPSLEYINEPEPVPSLEYINEPEPVPSLEYINEPEPVPSLEYINEPEPVPSLEYINEPEPVPSLEYINEPESVPSLEYINEPEPVLTLETESDEHETLQVEKETLDINNENHKEIHVPASQEEKKSERSTIPFNVIMLKQDKKKWQQAKESKAPVVADAKKVSTDKVATKVIPIKEVVTSTESNQNIYHFPTVELLTPPVHVEEEDNWIDDQKELLNTTLINFNVGAQVVNVTQGPSVTRFEVQPEPGVKVNKITNLSDDIKLSLAARDIRIEAPIPGKHTIGIEVPNPKSRPVLLREIIDSPEFLQQGSPLTAALGLDISGKPIVTDLSKMPHGLIAGATGSGKSVCINTILVSLIYKARPDELKLLLIDPKMVELAPYNRIPHLVSPVITDVKAATASLKWAVDEMERRYELFAHEGCRDIHRFNEMAEEHGHYSHKLPYIVIIIDELADLMMMSPADVEEAIARIAQKARACGIHLIIATQRPSVDVITGLIKANIPTRIAFSVSSQVDSRTIIDISGAEKLLGRGDMLFLENGTSKPVRLQGTFVSDYEIDEVVAYARKQGEPQYLFQQEELLKKAQVMEEEDELFYEACEFVVDHGGASTSSLQRRFKIGYNRAARLIDLMEQQGFISESKGSKPRDVLITEEDLETLQETSMMS